MRVAVLADAHGNLLALEAVLADLHAQAPDLVVNLGDLATGPFSPTTTRSSRGWLALALRASSCATTRICPGWSKLATLQW